MSLDIDDALNRVGGDIEFLKELMADFLKNFGNIHGELIKYIKADDIDSAKVLIHSFKGVSGSLGAMELHLIGKKIEDLIKNSTFDISNLLMDKLNDELKLVKTEMFEIIEPEVEDALKEFDKDLIIELLDNLSELLNNKKVQEIKVLTKELLTFNYPDDVSDYILEIFDSVKKYKFAVTLTAVEKILKYIRE